MRLTSCFSISSMFSNEFSSFDMRLSIVIDETIVPLSLLRKDAVDAASCRRDGDGRVPNVDTD